MAANSPGISAFTLRLGVDELIYSNLTATGIPQTVGFATNVQANFGLPVQMSNYRGRLILTASPIGGTITTATISFLVSLDGGVTFPVLNLWSGTALQPYSAVNLITTATPVAVGIDVSGLGGNGALAINVTTLTKGTGSGINIYGHIG